MQKPSVSRCLIVLLAIILCQPLLAKEASATAAWAEVDITPPLGIGLGGRGGPSAPSNKVIDPIYAQVLYLKDASGKGFVLVSFDLVGMSHDVSDRIRREIVREL